MVLLKNKIISHTLTLSFMLIIVLGGGPQKLDNVLSSESDPDRRI